jgi:hypothetical protein
MAFEHLPKDCNGYPINVGDRISHTYWKGTDETPARDRHGTIVEILEGGVLDCTDFDTGGGFVVQAELVRHRPGTSEREKRWARTCQEFATVIAPRRRRN